MLTLLRRLVLLSLVLGALCTAYTVGYKQAKFDFAKTSRPVMITCKVAGDAIVAYPSGTLVEFVGDPRTR
jgi:hypothetical protein